MTDREHMALATASAFNRSGSCGTWPIREGEREENPEERSPAGDVGQEGPSPPPTAERERETPDELDALADLAAGGGPVGKMAAARLRSIHAARGKTPGSSAKNPPGPVVGDSTPIIDDSTTHDTQQSRRESPTEHNNYYRTVPASNGP
jgi:hypothetical protein